MKPTIKVSIGGMAFNLENDAYQLIEDYLKKLNTRFENNPEGKEIIADVEYRIAELLQMRQNGKNGAVTAADADGIISIMGNPTDFDGEQAEEASCPPKEKTQKSGLQKRLYRNPDNKVFAGVCSGLGSYFNIDPVIIRILFIALLLTSWWLPHFRGMHEVLTDTSAILLYIIFWIAMPKAQTLEQKIAMTGKDPGIENVGQPLQQNRGTGVWKVIKVCFGIIIGIKLLCILLALIATIALFLGFSFNSDYPSFTTVLDILALNHWDVKLSALMIIVLPLLGIGYLCYKLLFWKRFTVRDAVISLLALILWAGACCYIGGVALNIASKHEQSADATETIDIKTASNTLYVKMMNEYADAVPVFVKYKPLSMLYSKNAGNSSLIYVPQIVIRKDSTLSAFKIDIQKIAIDETRSAAQYKADSFHPDYTITDSLFVVKPLVFNKQHTWDRQSYYIIIRHPANKKVALERFPPNSYVYKDDSDYCGSFEID
ncbi:MAG: PspC domain-containing protein [Prevotella sp.]|jgi:phage shock protein PspC (stress-responsive transcriptional regulator)|nr:PspC domain-containing protein [Prevotella sp.]